MTTATVSQGGVECLYRVTPGMRASQAGAELLHRVGTPMSVSQGGVELLHRVTPTFFLSQGGVEILFKNVPCATKWAQIWTITRTDAVMFRFTSLDRDLEYPAGSGIIYRSCGSLDPSASENVAELDSAGNMDLSGAIITDRSDPELINQWDLYAGRFDAAEVEVWLVPWAGEGRPKRLMAGTFAPVELTDSGFKTEVAGDGDKLTQTPLVETLQPGCRWKFGDPVTCGKDLGPLTVTGTAEFGDGVREFTDSARTEPDGYFKFGNVTFLDGNNAGITAEIKEHAAGVFTLWPRLPFPVLSGTNYSMTPGCTNLKESDGGCNGCTAWGQLARFGGFDKVPGRDKRGKAAEVRTS